MKLAHSSLPARRLVQFTRQFPASSSVSTRSIHNRPEKPKMKIGITGARGTVGQAVVKYCAENGHHTVQINRTDQEYDGTKNSEMRTADAANDYDATVEAFRGCDAIIHLAAIPNPVGTPDWKVFSNNTASAFNGLRACGELGIKKIAYASSVNAIGLAYANQPLKFPYFPIDEDYPSDPTDSYAIAKSAAELTAKAFTRWFPDMHIACLRIHEVAARAEVKKEHEGDWQATAVNQLFGWVSPEATARACFLAVESEKVRGFQIYNIIAPDTTQDTPSRELAKKYFPDAEIRGDFEGNCAFWTSSKAKKDLNWEHTEKE